MARFLNRHKNWLWLLLIPYAYFVWVQSPSGHHNQPACAEYADALSGYEVVIAPTDDTAEQSQTKYNEREKLKATLECSDLHAQWAMADITFWAFGAGVAGILLVFLTWLATRQSVQTARDASKQQTRAYVHAKSAKITTRGVQLRVENTGATPAKWFEIAAISSTIDLSEQDMTADFASVTNFTRWPALANGNTLTAGAESANEIKNIEQARSGRNLFLVYGIIRYKTVFNEVIETQFAFHHHTPTVDTDLARPPIEVETYRLKNNYENT